jgi:hypothetical protein
MALGGHVCGRRCDRDWLTVIAGWSAPRFHTIGVALLAAASGHGSGICVSYPYRDDLTTANELDLIATLAVRYSMDRPARFAPNDMVRRAQSGPP